MATHPPPRSSKQIHPRGNRPSGDKALAFAKVLSSRGKVASSSPTTNTSQGYTTTNLTALTQACTAWTCRCHRKEGYKIRHHSHTTRFNFSQPPYNWSTPVASHMGLAQRL